MEPGRAISVFTLVPILSHINPVHIFLLPMFNILHLRRGLLSGLLPSGFSTKMYEFFIYPMRATCQAHPILLDLITPVIFGESCKFQSSSLCSLLQSPATSTKVKIFS
jgi:hypothetical protein